MSSTLSVRLPEDLAAWLKETAERTGQTQGEVVRLQLEKARAAGGQKPWMALAGSARGLPRDLSTREGFAER
ncbi:MAG: ribbon-helix-helix protein, CopG family [Verrucomicrobiales bacterium]|nr:ribbon-helix-helix protein, CopG family [Verrucomicrobiales bacterium]